MKRIVQCVPNFSEGRRLNIIEKIIAPLKNQKGFKLISYEPDADYNRTVVTLIGDIDALIEPLLNFFSEALNYIDMNQHSGEHPRMGAVDVVPFIPITGITIEECISIATELAKKVNERFSIPVYLYANAANYSERENLPTIRSGEFEGMKEKIKEDKWLPDFGEPKIHETFGAVAIGARMPLIAYNIDLDTKDEKIANKIARTIRKSSGGFQYVQAGPAFLEEKGHVQVTMNILDYKKNPIYRIFETVKMEAKRYGIKATSSELIGLCPKDALIRSISYYLDIEKIPYKKDMSLEDITIYSIKYLNLRNFNIM
ncbi:MAG TPA: glutamate formimidoyltransferase, partial [Acholeplasmataceae bacterium]|nr:glutamate formimidoyltransferase [Acholeplasmataceae bacterium]